MVEISKSGSGEGLGWATGPGYSTAFGERVHLTVAAVGSLPLRARPARAGAGGERGDGQ
jgi:hypothetical protein